MMSGSEFHEADSESLSAMQYCIAGGDGRQKWEAGRKVESSEWDERDGR
jgi:hypothetical protein